MDLERGQCCCCNGNKILKHQSDDVCEKLFKHFFGDGVVDSDKMKDNLILLKWCPMCFQQVLLVLEGLNNLKQITSSVEEDHCIMCRSDDYTVKIKNWPYFEKILEEFDQKTKCVMCLNCIYYVHMRNILKENIFNKCPELKNISLHSLLDSSPNPAKNTPSKRTRSSAAIEISDDEGSFCESKIPIFEKFKPLMHDRYFGKLEIIHDDPKFFSKIPYTKLQVYSVDQKALKDEWTKHCDDKSDDSNEEVQPPKRNMFFKIKLKSSHNNRYKIVKSKPTITKVSSKLKKKSLSFYSEDEELKRHNISQSLSINIQKIINLGDILSATKKTENNGLFLQSESIETVEPDKDEAINKKEQSILQEEKESEIEIQLLSEEEGDVSSKRHSDGSSKKEESKPLLTEQEHEMENQSVGDQENEKESSNSDLNDTPKIKKYKPKPLSKRKNDLQKETETPTIDTIDQKEEEEMVCKPGPLSKKNRRPSTLASDEELEQSDNEKLHSNTNDDETNIDEIKDKRDESHENTPMEETTENAEECESDVQIIEFGDDEAGQTSTNETIKNTVENILESMYDDKDGNKIENVEDKQEELANVKEGSEKQDLSDQNEEIENENKENEEIAEQKTRDENEMKVTDKESEEHTEEKTDDQQAVENAMEEQCTNKEKDSNETSNGDEGKEIIIDDDSENEKEENGLDEGNQQDVENTNGDSSIMSNKRKADENSEVTPDKKKKRVTFSDEVLESS